MGRGGDGLQLDFLLRVLLHVSLLHHSRIFRHRPPWCSFLDSVCSTVSLIAILVLAATHSMDRQRQELCICLSIEVSLSHIHTGAGPHCVQVWHDTGGAVCGAGCWRQCVGFRDGADCAVRVRATHHWLQWIQKPCVLVVTGRSG